MPFRIVAAAVILLGALLQAQTRVRTQPRSQSLQKDDLASAREATDTFLNGVKLAELPEGRQLLLETQWITGEADNGENFYLRPRFTEVISLFEKLFDTDVPGVQGYKRLLDMKAVSEAGTPLLTKTGARTGGRCLTQEPTRMQMLIARWRTSARSSTKRILRRNRTTI